MLQSGRGRRANSSWLPTDLEARCVLDSIARIARSMLPPCAGNYVCAQVQCCTGRPGPAHFPSRCASHVLVEPPPRRQVGRWTEAAAPRLSERGAGAGASGRFRRGAHVVSPGAARSSQRSAHPAEHGDRVLAHRADERGGRAPTGARSSSIRSCPARTTASPSCCSSAAISPRRQRIWKPFWSHHRRERRRIGGFATRGRRSTSCARRPRTFPIKSRRRSGNGPRGRQPEGRRRQDDDRHQPRERARAARTQDAARRRRPTGRGAAWRRPHRRGAPGRPGRRARRHARAAGRRARHAAALAARAARRLGERRRRARNLSRAGCRVAQARRAVRPRARHAATSSSWTRRRD